MALYIAHLRDDGTTETFCLSSYAEIELTKEYEFPDSEVLAVYEVKMPLAEAQMMSVLLAIDDTTNTCLVEDLLARVFESGYQAGNASV